MTASLNKVQSDRCLSCLTNSILTVAIISVHIYEQSVLYILTLWPAGGFPAVLQILQDKV